MKKALWKAAVFSVTLLLASACVAQTNRAALIANVSFPFVVANQTLRPGRYIVTRLGETNLRIYSLQDRGVIVQAHSVQGTAPESAGKIVFYRYGETYVLSQVWFAANANGQQLYKSRIEEELARRGNSREIAVVRESHNGRP